MATDAGILMPSASAIPSEIPFEQIEAGNSKQTKTNAFFLLCCSPGIDEVETLGNERQPIVGNCFNLRSYMCPLLPLGRWQQTC